MKIFPKYLVLLTLILSRSRYDGSLSTPSSGTRDSPKAARPVGALLTNALTCIKPSVF
jgi:hypothetical protein